MNALIVDPAVHSLGGHHYNTVERLQRELARLGVVAPCLGSAQADETTRQALACTPVFSRSVYGRQDDDDRTFPAEVARVERELAQALAAHAVPDLLILPCADTVLAAALARLLRHGRHRRPRVLLWLLYGPHPLKAPGDPELAPHRLRARQAYAALGEVADVHAWCETEAMATFWRTLVSFEVGVRSPPGLATPGLATPRKSPREAAAPPVVACLGFANRAKGYRLLPGALPIVLERDANARFLVHGIVDGSDAADERPLFDRLAGLGGRVAVRQDVLDAATYVDLMATTDLLLLPYDPAVYGMRGSGIFADARRIGIPVVAPRGCAFAGPAFDGGWGVPMETYDPAGLAGAVLAGLAQRQALAERAAAAAARERDDLERLLTDALAGLPLPAPGRLARLRDLCLGIGRVSRSSLLRCTL